MEDNGVERAGAEIWCGLLQVDRVERDDNFLLLGGEAKTAGTTGGAPRSETAAAS
jgi:hypothetical protein